MLRAIDRHLPVPMRRRARYLAFHHRPLHLARPRTFTEKVQWRMVHDRRDILRLACDKLASKAAAALVPGVSVPRTLWAGTDVRELADVALPQRWVLKPNHRYGLVHFGAGAVDGAAAAALASRTAGWLAEPRSGRGEWGYGGARRALLVEEMLGGDRPPDDTKVMVFDGVPGLVQVDHDRFGRRRHRLYSPGWEALGGDGRLEDAAVEPPPARLGELLSAASALGAGYDMVRVDLYDVAGRTWFGELTAYPGSGLQRLEPRSLDQHLGSLWRLPTLDRVSSPAPR